MLEARGEFWIGEAKGCNWALSRRLSGFGLGAFALFLASVMVAEIAFPLLARIFLPERLSDSISPLLIVAIGAGSVWAWLSWRTTSLKRAWRSRGVADPHLTTFRVTEEGLLISSPNVDTTYRWSAVSEIAPFKRYWLVVVPGLGYTIPRRFFADASAEREFLGAALGRMNEAAKARSREAAKFVSG